MTTYYVDATLGDDTKTGLTPAKAWKTTNQVNIMFNAGSIHAGDTILFKAGETWDVSGYGKGIDVRKVTGTTSTRRVTLDAYGSGALPTIDGLNLVASPLIGGYYNGHPENRVDHVTVNRMRFVGSTSQECHLYDTEDWEFNFCKFGNDQVYDNAGHAVMMHDVDTVLLNHCGVYGLGGGGATYIGDALGGTYESNITFRYCWIEEDIEEGLDYKQNTSYITAEHCTVIGGSVDGNCSTRGTDHVFRNCLFINNYGTHNMYFPLSAQRITIDNCLMMGSNIGIRLSGATCDDVYITNNIIEGQTIGIQLAGIVTGVEIFHNRLHNCATAFDIWCGWGAFESEHNFFNGCAGFAFGGVGKVLADLQAQNHDLVSIETDFELYIGVWGVGGVGVPRTAVFDDVPEREVR